MKHGRHARPKMQARGPDAGQLAERQTLLLLLASGPGTAGDLQARLEEQGYYLSRDAVRQRLLQLGARVQALPVETPGQPPTWALAYPVKGR